MCFTCNLITAHAFYTAEINKMKKKIIIQCTFFIFVFSFQCCLYFFLFIIIVLHFEIFSDRIIFVSFLGGLFDTEDDEQELAFRIAVDKINGDSSVLPRSRLVAQVERVGVDDSFRATKKGKS